MTYEKFSKLQKKLLDQADKFDKNFDSINFAIKMKELIVLYESYLKERFINNK